MDILVLHEITFISYKEIHEFGGASREITCWHPMEGFDAEGGWCRCLMSAGDLSTLTPPKMWIRFVYRGLQNKKSI